MTAPAKLTNLIYFTMTSWQELAQKWHTYYHEHNEFPSYWTMWSDSTLLTRDRSFLTSQTHDGLAGRIWLHTVIHQTKRRTPCQIWLTLDKLLKIEQTQLQRKALDTPITQVMLSLWHRSKYDEHDHIKEEGYSVED